MDKLVVCLQQFYDSRFLVSFGKCSSALYHLTASSIRKLLKTFLLIAQSTKIKEIIGPFKYGGLVGLICIISFHYCVDRKIVRSLCKFYMVRVSLESYITKA